MLCDELPKTNAERLADWYDKGGPFMHLAERWLRRIDKPEEDHPADQAGLFDVPTHCRRQAC